MPECPDCHKMYDSKEHSICPHCVPPAPPLMGQDTGGEEPPAPPPMEEPADGPVVAVSQSPDEKYIRRANASSRVDRPQMDRFIEGLINKGLGFPMFSVCDCNSFHTSGYLWGLYAAKMLEKDGKPKGPVAVINFDQHNDIGSVQYHDVRSDGWGVPLLNRLTNLGFGGCYMSVGVGSERGALATSPRMAGAGCASYASHKKAAFVKLWKKLMESLGNTIKYIFISIDRDCLQGNYTQWGDGYFKNTADLTNHMGKVLESLFEACEEREKSIVPQFIGFDITGLPEHRKLLSSAPKKPDEIWKDLDTQLVEIKSWITTFAARYSRRSPEERVRLETGKRHTLVLDRSHCTVTINWSRVVFFSGSISYALDERLEEYDWKGYALTHWDYADYVWWIGRNLKRTLSGKWQFVLCTQEPPVMVNGWKEFELYRPGSSISIALEQKKATYINVPTNPLVVPRSESAKIAKEVLGRSLHKLGGFACTASIKSDDRLHYFESEKAGREYPHYVIFDSTLNGRGEWKPV